MISPASTTLEGHGVRLEPLTAALPARPCEQAANIVLLTHAFENNDA